ncbi:hypothetical protein VPH35_011488 [Triticum aestivum]
MIQPTDIDHDGTVKYCRVHDMVLDLIISLSDEQNFAIVLNGRVCNSFPNKIRRLSMKFSGKEHNAAVYAITETKKYVRSLTTFRQVQQIPHLVLVDFLALRVLDLEGFYYLENKHVKHIGSSRQLRYLRIHSGKITELPDEIGKLQQLETLDLRHCYSLLRLPSTMVQLQKLVRLFVTDYTQLPASEFRSLQALGELRFSETDDPVRIAEEVNELGKCNLRYLRTGEIAERLFCNPCCTYPCLQVLKIKSDIEMEMVPRGMASLKNLMRLWIQVRQFEEEGLQVLMGMPSLTHLQLNIQTEMKEKLAVGSNGFKLLKVFRFKYRSNPSAFKFERTSSGGLDISENKPDGLGLTFVPGAVPALRCLCLKLSPMTVASDFFADLGVEHLPGLVHLKVEINCNRATPGRVEAVESSVEKAINLHTNREIHVQRVSEDSMFKDEKEWEEAVLKKRKEMEEMLRRILDGRLARRNET